MAESLCFHDWERIKNAQDQQNFEDAEVIVEDVTEEIPKTENKTNASESIDTRTCEIEENVNLCQKLCRVCSNNGLISINAAIKGFLKIKPSAHPKLWDIPISQIIAEVSGEMVSSDDLLPQFICQHCLGYLVHCYELRLKIRSTSASLRLVGEIARRDDSILLETGLIGQSKITKREVDESNENISEDKHFYETFQYANIKINSSTDINKRNKQTIEQKCHSCKARLMSMEALNQHKDQCELIILEAFYSDFQRIFAMRLEQKITSYEFILYAIRLLFDNQKKLQKIVKAKKIDVNAINSQLPPIEFPTVQPQSARNYIHDKRSHASPDNGYTSGDKPNYATR